MPNDVLPGLFLIVALVAGAIGYDLGHNAGRLEEIERGRKSSQEEGKL